jgi:hypothetical protein
LEVRMRLLLFNEPRADLTKIDDQSCLELFFSFYFRESWPAGDLNAGRCWFFKLVVGPKRAPYSRDQSKGKD